MNKRDIVYNKYDGKCAYCGCDITIKNMHIDHIFPKCKKHFLRSEKMKEMVNVKIDDINDIDNLNPSCASCNMRKSAFTLEQFRTELKYLRHRLNKYVPNYRIAIRYGLIKETKIKDIYFYFEKVR